VVAVAVLAFLGAVAPAAFAQAPAPKVTVEGFLDQTTAWSNNGSVLDIDITKNKDKEWYARTRGRFQITGEVGKAKGVFLFEQDNNWGSQAGTCYTGVGAGGVGGGAGRGGHFGVSDGCLNTELVGNVEMLWMYTEFPLFGSGSLLPFVPAPGTLRLGFQPFENDTYKLGILAFGNYGGGHAEVDLAPGVKFVLTYAQVEEAGTGRPFGNVRGDDYSTIFSLEVSPIKGLDVKPIYAYTYIDGTSNPANDAFTPTFQFAYGQRTGKGGVWDGAPTATRAGFVAGNTESRHTLGVDARWKMGPWSLDPTFFYQFGTREMAPSVASGKRLHSCGALPGGATPTPLGGCVEQDMSAWIFDVRGGWQSGPLTLEGMFVWAGGNEAKEDLRSGRTIHYYQPIDTNAVYGYQWGAITAISDEYITQLYYGSTGLCAACSISYDKYGSIRLGVRGGYAVTPAFKLRAVLMNLWTAEDVDTTSIVDAGGLTATRTGPASRGKSSYLGTETDIGFDWNFAPNISLLTTYGHLFAGDAYKILGTDPGAVGAVATSASPRSPKDVDMLSMVVRYIF
jgi:hypothetical protein